jgi:hypothetical protein
MLENIDKKLSKLKCKFVSNASDLIIEKNYGVKKQVKSFDEDPKYLKIQKDFYTHYSQYTENELKAQEILYNKNKTKKGLTNVVLLDDTLYNWFLSNITNIQTSLSNISNSERHLEYIQATPSSSWVFIHNFGFPPVINVTDLFGNELIGYVRTDNPTNTITTITFDSPLTGRIIGS